MSGFTERQERLAQLKRTDAIASSARHMACSMIEALHLDHMEYDTNELLAGILWALIALGESVRELSAAVETK